jgi:hypothetical protein
MTAITAAARNMWFSGLPAQPGHQAPGGAAESLNHDEALQPGFHVPFAVVIILIGGRHQGGGAHRGGHRQRQEHRISEADMAEDTGGTENGAAQRPERRGDACILGSGRSQCKLRLEDARLALLPFGDKTQNRHARNLISLLAVIIGGGLLIITEVLAHCRSARFGSLFLVDEK